MEGHPLIHGRPWLATTDAYIGCRVGSMSIIRRDLTKNIIIYLPAKPSLSMVKIHKHPDTYWEKNIHPPLTLVEALEFKDQTEDDVINNFMNQSPKPKNMKCQMMKTILEHEDQEDPVTDFKTQHISTTIVPNSKPIEIEPGKVLNINASLDDNQK